MMQAKLINGITLWHGEKESTKAKSILSDSFDFSNIDLLSKFKGKHPAVFKDRIESKNWQFDYELSYNRRSFKDRAKNLLQELTGKNDLFEYKNYKLL
jgi:hypothetical protein